MIFERNEWFNTRNFTAKMISFKGDLNGVIGKNNIEYDKVHGRQGFE